MKAIPKMPLLMLGAILLIVGVAVWAFAPHPPAVPRRVASVTELEGYLRRLVASGSPPGLTVAVVKDGHTTYVQAFGLADGPRGTQATAETVYHWWSMTKIPTAVAVLQLQEHGRLNLDDPVTSHLPWFDVKYPAATDHAITLRHLLQHSSGLPDVAPAMFGWVHSDDAGRDQTALVRKFLPQYRVLTFAPGEKAVYSNLNYMVLGAVIEAVTGKTYETYVIDHVLRPLGMNQTGFIYSPEMVRQAATGTLPVVHFYTPLLPLWLDARAIIREKQGNLFWFNRVYVDVTPSTGLIGPATDVARFMLAYLNHGELDGAIILKPETVTQMSQAAPLGGHGLGWFVTGGPGQFYLEHPGGGPGFATLMRLYPDRQLGIAILSNGTELDRAGLADLMASLDW